MKLRPARFSFRFEGIIHVLFCMVTSVSPPIFAYFGIGISIDSLPDNFNSMVSGQHGRKLNVARCKIF